MLERYHMQYRQLGRTDLKVSQIYRTLNLPKQNNQGEVSQQLDTTLSYGVSVFDITVLYLVLPVSKPI